MPMWGVYSALRAALERVGVYLNNEKTGQDCWGFVEERGISNANEGGETFMDPVMQCLSDVLETLTTSVKRIEVYIVQ